MTRAQLLTALDPLSHSERLAFLAQHVVAHRHDSELRKLRRDLAKGDAYEASLALHISRVLGEVSGAVELLTHPSLSVALGAAKEAARSPAWALRELLEVLPGRVRRALLGAVGRGGAPGMAHAFYTDVRARWGDGEATLLLAGLTAEQVAAELPGLGYQIESWHLLAVRHPAAVEAYLRGRLAGASLPLRHERWSEHSVALRELGRARPGLLLGLARDFPNPGLLPWALEVEAGRLLRHDPAGAAAVYTDPSLRAHYRQQGLPAGVQAQAHRMPEPAQAALAALAGGHWSSFMALLRLSPPRRRGALFEAAYPEARTTHLPFTPGMLELLPAALRDALVPGQLARPDIERHPTLTWAFQALRSDEAVLPPLEQASARPDAGDRQAALQARVSWVQANRRGLTELLGGLKRLKNEQDPVRAAALGALAGLPVALFTEAHVARLAEQATWAAEARDGSAQTLQAVQRLALRLLAGKAPGGLQDWSCAALRQLARRSPDLGFALPVAALPQGSERQVIDAVRPAIDEALARGDTGPAFAALAWLGVRGWALPDRARWIDAGLTAKDTGVQREAARLLLRAPEGRAARVRALLDRDPSFIAAPDIESYVWQQRQAWLDPYLSGQPTPGALLPADRFHLLDRRGGLSRLLPRQQRALAALWQRTIAAAPSLGAHLIGSLGRLPTTTAEDLAPYLEGKDTAQREAALAALAWLDTPGPAVPLLVARADEGEARVALYALGRALRGLPPGRALEAVQGLLALPRLKVSSHKEAVRLVGALRLPGALALLEAEARRPGLHRDVRIAVGHAAGALLDQPGAWALLDTLAHAEDLDEARSVLDLGLRRLSDADRRRWVERALEVARHRDPATRALAWSALTHRAEPGADLLGAAAVAEALDLEAHSGDQALQTLLRCAGLGLELGRVRDLVEGLLLAATHEATKRPVPGKDLIASQRLRRAVSLLHPQSEPMRAALSGLNRELADLLLDHPWAWGLGAGLLLASLDLGQRVAGLRGLESLAARVPEWGLGSLDERLQGLGERLLAEVPESALGWVSGLRAAGASAAVLAVGVLRAVGPGLGWPAAALEELFLLRQHPDAQVKAAALGVGVG
jgi:hypothetical protein